MIDLEKYIRDVPDFPKEGIIFKDITPLLGDPPALREAVSRLAAPYEVESVDVVTGVESHEVQKAVNVAEAAELFRKAELADGSFDDVRAGLLECLAPERRHYRVGGVDREVYLLVLEVEELAEGEEVAGAGGGYGDRVEVEADDVVQKGLEEEPLVG